MMIAVRSRSRCESAAETLCSVSGSRAAVGSSSTRTAGADNRADASGGDAKGDSVEHDGFTVMAERDVLEGDFAAYFVELCGIGPLDDFGRRVEQFKDAAERNAGRGQISVKAEQVLH